MWTSTEEIINAKLMKKSFLPLMIGMVVILTSMSDCLKFEATEYSIVKAKIDGRLYMSDTEEVYSTWPVPYTQYTPPIEFTTYRVDSLGNYGYLFEMRKELHSDDGDTCNFYVRMNGKMPIVLNTRRNIEDEGFVKVYFVDSDGETHTATSTSGYWIFTACDESSNYADVAGIFEFSATEAETGITVEVTEGSFIKFND